MEESLLNNNDKQRIQQEACNQIPHGYQYWPVFIRAAEYATTYEREQQTKEIERLKDNITWLEGDIDVREIREDQQAKRIEQLEAERSELVNLLTEIGFLLGPQKSGSQSEIYDKIKAALNSLKTK